LEGVFGWGPVYAHLLVVNGLVGLLDFVEQLAHLVLVHLPGGVVLVFVDVAEVLELLLELLEVFSQLLQVVSEFLVFLLVHLEVGFDLLTDLAHLAFECAQLFALVFLQVLVVVFAPSEHGHVLLDGLLVKPDLGFVHFHLHLQLLDLLLDVDLALTIDLHFVEDVVFYLGVEAVVFRHSLLVFALLLLALELDEVAERLLVLLPLLGLLVVEEGLELLQPYFVGFTQHLVLVVHFADGGLSLTRELLQCAHVFLVALLDLLHEP